MKKNKIDFKEFLLVGLFAFVILSAFAFFYSNFFPESIGGAYIQGCWYGSGINCGGANCIASYPGYFEQVRRGGPGWSKCMLTHEDGSCECRIFNGNGKMYCADYTEKIPKRSCVVNTASSSKQGFSCGELGKSKGYAQSYLRCQTSDCFEGYSNLGTTYDCVFCCAKTTVNEPSAGTTTEPSTGTTTVTEPTTPDIYKSIIPPTITEPAAAVPVPSASQIRCTAVAQSNDDGFFSMSAFNNKLYAGEYGGEGKEHIKIFDGVGWRDSNPGLDNKIGESICYLLPFNGYLYANTENSGKVFRTADGNNWQEVWGGVSGHIGCGMAVFNNNLYKTEYDYEDQDRAMIHRSATGSSWSELYNSNQNNIYLKEIAVYGSKIYGFAKDNENGQGGWLVSSTGNSGTWTWQNKGQRFFRSYNDGPILWLGSASSSGPSGGVTGIWKFDGTNLQKMYTADGFSHITGIRRWKGGLLALASTGFKISCSNRAGLFYSSDEGRTWTRVCQNVIGEPEAWALEIYQNDAYFGTMCYGGHGHVYNVTA